MGRTPTRSLVSRGHRAVTSRHARTPLDGCQRPRYPYDPCWLAKEGNEPCAVTVSGWTGAGARRLGGSPAASGPCGAPMHSPRSHSLGTPLH
jgi:hypothetical protein